jgi:hypothetical protein
MRALLIGTLSLGVVSTALADDTGFAGMHEWVKERGRTCFKDHFHTGNGEGSTKSAARKAAITSWREFTAFEYGTDWANYRYAASKKVAYTKSAKGWSASVDARPCYRKAR